MPVHRVIKNGRTVGYQWGETGKIYPTKQAAQRQAKAIYAQGYKPKK